MGSALNVVTLVKNMALDLSVLLDRANSAEYALSYRLACANTWLQERLHTVTLPHQPHSCHPSRGTAIRRALSETIGKLSYCPFHILKLANQAAITDTYPLFRDQVRAVQYDHDHEQIVNTLNKDWLLVKGNDELVLAEGMHYLIEDLCSHTLNQVRKAVKTARSNPSHPWYLRLNNSFDSPFATWAWADYFQQLA